jgi:hypothetical protein
MLRNFGFGLLLGAALLFLNALAHSVLPRYEERVEKQSASPVVAGLRLKVKSLHRQGGVVRMTYALERAGSKGWSWFLIRRFGPVDISFWDAEGRKVGEDHALFIVSRNFALGSKPSPWGPLGCSAYLLWPPSDEAPNETEFVPPPGATHVSFSLGDVSTRPVPLP